MAHKSTIFKKICRIITSLIGIGDSIFLIFAYSNKYWLIFFGYRYLVFSLFFLLFSLGAFLSAILVFILPKKYFMHLEYYFSFFFVIDFFFALSILYFSSLKTKEEAYYWINEYNITHQGQQIMNDFNRDYPSNKIDSYVRHHTIVLHDTILLSIFIWLVWFILYTFFSHKIMKYLNDKKLSPKNEVIVDHNISELINDVETEYEYEYLTESNEGNNIKGKGKMKISHVRSADKILHLVNINDKPSSQLTMSSKRKSDVSDNKSLDSNDKDNSEAKDNENIINDNKSSNQSPGSLTSSLTLPTVKESDTKSTKKKVRRNKRKSPLQSKDKKGNFKDEISESTVVSISPINTKNTLHTKPKYKFPKQKWNESELSLNLSDNKPPRRKYPKVRRPWDEKISLSLSSESLSSGLLLDEDNMYSTVILYDSDDSVSFGFDYSDSW